MDFTNIKETIKTMLISLIPASYFIWNEQMACALFTLLLVSALDLFTGVVKSFVLGTFQTSIAWAKSRRKLVGLFIACMLGYILDVGVGHSGAPLWSVLDGVFIGICFFYVAIESLSILENLNDMNFPVPTQLIYFFRRNIKKPIIKK